VSLLQSVVLLLVGGWVVQGGAEGTRGTVGEAFKLGAA
jgi:hypothetical protein